MINIFSYNIIIVIIIINNINSEVIKMKLKKTVHIFLLSAIIAFGACFDVFAAPNDDIISALNSNGVPQQYVIQAENYLKNHTLTASQASAVIGEINKAGAIMNAAGTKDLSKLKSSDLQSIFQCAKNAAAAAKLNIEADKDSSGKIKIVVMNTNGTVAADFSPSGVKQTGLDTSFLYKGGILIAASALLSLFLKRKALV